MRVEDLPGQVVHIRLEGAGVSVVFEHIPWSFQIADITGAIQAFSCNDWTYFKERWWQEHQFIHEASSLLKQLASQLETQKIYSPSCLVDLAKLNGINCSEAGTQYMRDFQRLSLIPKLHHWPREGSGMVVSGKQPAIGWPGRFWRDALLGDAPATAPFPKLISIQHATP